jgi:hypothetical protein
MVKEQDVAVWIGFKWFWIDAVLVFFEHGNKLWTPRCREERIINHISYH